MSTTDEVMEGMGDEDEESEESEESVGEDEDEPDTIQNRIDIFKNNRCMSQQTVHSISDDLRHNIHADRVLLVEESFDDVVSLDSERLAIVYPKDSLTTRLLIFVLSQTDEMVLYNFHTDIRVMKFGFKCSYRFPQNPSFSHNLTTYDFENENKKCYFVSPDLGKCKRYGYDTKMSKGSASAGSCFGVLKTTALDTVIISQELVINVKSMAERVIPNNNGVYVIEEPLTTLFGGRVIATDLEQIYVCHKRRITLGYIGSWYWRTEDDVELEDDQVFVKKWMFGKSDSDDNDNSDSDDEPGEVYIGMTRIGGNRVVFLAGPEDEDFTEGLMQLFVVPIHHDRNNGEIDEGFCDFVKRRIERRQYIVFSSSVLINFLNEETYSELDRHFIEEIQVSTQVEERCANITEHYSTTYDSQQPIVSYRKSHGRVYNYSISDHNNYILFLKIAREYNIHESVLYSIVFSNHQSPSYKMPKRLDWWWHSGQ